MSVLPSITSLRAFETAARRLTFQDAAAELGVAPTAVSHQIRRLDSIAVPRCFGDDRGHSPSLRPVRRCCRS